MNRHIIITLILLFSFLAGCGSIQPLPTEMPTANLTGTSTEVPQMTATVPPESSFKNRIMLGTPCEPNTDIQPWCLLSERGVQEINPPNPEAQLYDYDPETNRVLYASHFPIRGGGPANMSVTDLWLWDLNSGSIQLLVGEETVIKSKFSHGDALAYIRTRETTNELVWRSIEGLERVLAIDVPYLFSFSPDGSKIAFTRESNYRLGGEPGLYVVNIENGLEQKISHADRAGAGSSDDEILWSPDGSQMILPINLEWLLVSADGSRTASLRYSPDSDGQPWASYMPNRIQWYPDGSHLLVSVETGGPHNPEPVYWFLQVVAIDQLTGELSVRQVMDDFYLLLGWDLPGRSAWVLPVGEAKPPQVVAIEAP